MKTIHGRTVFPGGRTIEIMSEHQEWSDWAARAVDHFAEMRDRLRSVLRDLDDPSAAADRADRATDGEVTWIEGQAEAVRALLARIKETDR